MKIILICPSQASGIPALADAKPLLALPLLGESFIGHWMRYLTAAGFKQARLLTAEPPEILREIVGDGSRWGLNVEILGEARELNSAEARQGHRPSNEADWPAQPGDVVELDHPPGLPGHKLFSSYQSWFRALEAWLPIARSCPLAGFREVRPGVWMGRRARVSSIAKLHPPCWLGENTRVGRHAVIGPSAFLEDRVVVESACEVRQTWVGPDTIVGELLQLENSLAWGNLLMNWKSGSHTFVRDAFLLAPLRPKPTEATSGPAVEPRIAPPLARPFETVISLAQKLQG